MIVKEGTGMKLIYFHGFGSVGSTVKSFKLKEKFGAENVYSPDLPINPDEVIDLVHSYLTDCNEEVAFIGTSLGGFYANYFSKKYNSKCVLINPSINPSNSLKRKLGLNKNYVTSESFEVKDEYLKVWKEMEDDILHNDNSLVNLFLAKDDEILPFANTLTKFFDAHEIVITESGGHRYDTHWDNVIDFIGKL